VDLFTETKKGPFQGQYSWNLSGSKIYILSLE
jgi:hypothetical protein